MGRLIDADEALERIDALCEKYKSDIRSNALLKHTWTFIKRCPTVEPCDVAISRQAVLDILEREGHKWGNNYRDWVDAVKTVETLPPVNLQPKTGHWIEYRGYDSYSCSECDEFVDKKSRYCPNCGCRMVEPQEGSDKE